MIFSFGTSMAEEIALFCVIFTQNETSVFRRSPAAETGTVNVILTTASLPDFRAKIVQSLHKIILPPHHRLKQTRS